MNSFEDKYFTSMIYPREKKLLRLLFEDTVTKEDIDELTEGMDVDTENANYLLMLAYLGFQNGWKYFDGEAVPRLKGLHRYYQVRVAANVPWFLEQIDALLINGIDVMLFKGAAMSAYYAKNRPRIMGDYDIAVPADRFEQTRAVLKENDAILLNVQPHSYTFSSRKAVAAKKKLELDVHRWFFKGDDDNENQKLWDSAKEIDFHGRKVKVLCGEDMFIHQLNNQAFNLFYGEGSSKRMKWFFDCRSIIEKMKSEGEELNLSHIAKRAEEVHSVNQTRLMLKKFMEVYPDVIDASEFDRYFPETDSYIKWIKTGDKLNEIVAKQKVQKKEYQETGKGKLKTFYLNWKKYEYRELYRNFDNENTEKSKTKLFLKYTRTDSLGKMIGKYSKKVFGRK